MLANINGGSLLPGVQFNRSCALQCVIMASALAIPADSSSGLSKPTLNTAKWFVLPLGAKVGSWYLSLLVLQIADSDDDWTDEDDMDFDGDDDDEDSNDEDDDFGDVPLLGAQAGDFDDDDDNDDSVRELPSPPPQAA